jgi:hypothetical protein
MAADSMAKATIHEPVGAKNLWGHAGWQLPAYIQHIANDLRSNGMTESRAIATAVATVKRWAAGGGKVHPDTRAAAAKAVKEWEALKAKAAAAGSTRNLATPATPSAVDLATHRYRHGWIPLFTGRTQMESAARAVMTDGHAAIHGPDMVPVAHDVLQRLRGQGVTAGAHRIEMSGQPHIRIYDPARKHADLANGDTHMEIRAQQVIDLGDTRTIDLAAPSAAQMRTLAKQGEAMPGPAGPRFPIRNHTDVKKAVRAVGRAKGDHSAVRRFIARRAAAIGASHLIPANWTANGASK